jgi:hypothetical protein
VGTVKITSWNVAHLDRLVKEDLSDFERRRWDAVVREVRELSPDVLCILEGPKGEEAIDRVSNDLLGGEWVAVKAADGQYKTLGTQWIWFLVRAQHSEVDPRSVKSSAPVAKRTVVEPAMWAWSNTATGMV